MNALSNEPLVNHYRRVFDYDRWATRRVLEALAQAPKPPAKAVERLAHVVAAAELWLSRVDRAAEPPDSLNPTWGLHEVDERAERSGVRWSMFVGSLTDARLHQPVRYVNTEGQPREARLHEILTHLGHHGAYHRGQVAVDMRLAGLEPVVTDAIAFTARPV